MNRGIAILFSCSLIASTGTGCGKKVAECRDLIGSLNDLGTQLAATQKVTSDEHASPTQIAAALRPFSVSARSASKKLEQAAPTQPELRQIAQNAATATTALADASNQMADTAERLKGLDSAGLAVSEQKKSLDKTEAEIKRLCEANARACVELAQVLGSFPAPPEATGDAAATAAWTGKLNNWTKDLGKLELKDRALEVQVKAFESGWSDFGGALSALAHLAENAKRYDELAVSFNAQVDRANQFITAANRFCAD
jgi:hypothetical protein